MNVCRSPGIGAVGPGIECGLDAGKAIVATVIGQAAPASAEIGVQGCRVFFIGVSVAPTRIGLPDLDQDIRQSPSPLVLDFSVH